MPLLQATVLVTALLIPGFISLALALSPRSRAIRQSSLGTRVFGLLLLSLVDWLCALWLYVRLPLGDRDGHCWGLARLILGQAEYPAAGASLPGAPQQSNVEVLVEILKLPGDVLWGMTLVVGTAVIVGYCCMVLHSAVLSGFAINDFGLKANRLKGFVWWRYWISRLVERTMRRVGVADLFQPLGAAYWLVVLRAAVFLQAGSTRPDEAKVARVYADVIQGDDKKEEGKTGVLYTGTVKHLVCEIDGNIVFVLLTEARRWSASTESRLVSSGGETTSDAKKGRFKPIDNSEALGLDGRNIRNVSFRLIDKDSLTIKQWPKDLEESPAQPSAGAETRQDCHLGWLRSSLYGWATGRL